MWKQISLTEALQGYMAGQNVKLVDLVEETVVSLQNVFKNMQESAVFFAVTDDPVPEPEPVTATITGLPEGSTVQRVSEAISNAIRRVNDALTAAPEEESEKAEPEPKSEPDPPPKVTRAKKQLDEAEKAYQSRKISDLGKLRSLRAAGWDVEKIATEFGCSGQTVRNTMKREGIE